MAELLLCRCCKKRDIDKSKPDTYVNPSRGWYYHKDCYTNWIAKKDDVFAITDDDNWKDLLWDYLARDVKLPNINFQKIDHQWQTFLYKDKKRMTAKGLFFACRYYYEVLNGDRTKAEGGIGILPYVYDEGCAYWSNRKDNTAMITLKLTEQHEQQAQREVIKIKPREVKERQTMSLTEVMNLEDEE